MQLLWTDTLAALLVEVDRVPPEHVEAWVRRPSAYRLEDDGDPLELARRLLGGRLSRPGSGGGARLPDPPSRP